MEGIAKPFLSRNGCLSGLIMAIGEGNESKNAELIPFLQELEPQQ